MIPADIAYQSFPLPDLNGAYLSSVVRGFHFNLSVALENPIPASLSIGCFSLRLSLGGSKFLDLHISEVNLKQQHTSDVNFKQLQDVKISATVTFESGVGIESAVGQFVHDVLVNREGLTLSNSTLVIVGFDFGISLTEKIEVFNSINLPVPIPRGLYYFILIHYRLRLYCIYHYTWHCISA